MRAGLALIAALALCVTPAVAQGKVKSKGGADIGALAVEIVEVCEEFSRGDVLAVDDAIAKGWDAYETEGESPFVKTFNAHKELPGIGAALRLGLALRDNRRHAEGKSGDDGEPGAHRASPAPP